MASITNAL